MEDDILSSYSFASSSNKTSSTDLPDLEQFNPKDFNKNYEPQIKGQQYFIRGLIVSPSGGGKNVMLKDLMKNALKKHYDRILLFSGSIESGDFDFLNDKALFKNKIWISPHRWYKEDVLIGSILRNRQLLEERKKPIKTLVIFDDLGDSLKFSKVIRVLFTRGRHYAMSAILLTQDVKYLGPDIRNNCNFLVLIGQNNMVRLEDIIKERLGCLSNDQLHGHNYMNFWKRLIYEYTYNNDPYKALVIFPLAFDNKPKNFYNSVFRYKAKYYKY